MNQETKGPAPREADVPGEMRMLSSAVDEIFTDLASLFERMTPALREPEATASVESALDTVRAPLASDIRTARRRIQAMSSSIQEITRRLEL